MKRILTLAAFFFLLFHHSFGQGKKEAAYLLLVSDTIPHEKYGYVNQAGDTVIEMDKYPICFTDTFATFAIVLKEGVGYVGIDRRENVLFKIFTYDNGPDPPSEGLFRIIKKDKIGYANLEGNIVIEPRYSCAFPFSNGRAKVSEICSTVAEGEYRCWVSDAWFYIDKSGQKK